MTELAKTLNADLYPDVDASGGLVQALNGALRSIGSSLAARDLPLPVRFIVYAVVSKGSRQSQVYVAQSERLFVFDFWAKGVMLANGRTSDLVDVARAVDAWNSSSCTTQDLANECPYVTSEEKAAAFEQGAATEYEWLQRLEEIPKCFPELASFVIAAAAEPRLRQLYPFTSMWTFCFSRCTGYPFTVDVPCVTPQKDGTYQVRDRTGTVLGVGDAQHAVALVLANLPEGCGPAVPGTADDLKRARR